MRTMKTVYRFKHRSKDLYLRKNFASLSPFVNPFKENVSLNDVCLEFDNRRNVNTIIETIYKFYRARVKRSKGEDKVSIRILKQFTEHFNLIQIEVPTGRIILSEPIMDIVTFALLENVEW